MNPLGYVATLTIATLHSDWLKSLVVCVVCKAVGDAHEHLYITQSCTFLVVQTIKNPPAMQETWVCILGWEDPLDKGMARILAWRIPLIEEPDRL